MALLPPTREEEEIGEPAPNAGLQANAFPSPSRQARGEIATAPAPPFSPAELQRWDPLLGRSEICAAGVTG